MATSNIFSIDNKKVMVKKRKGSLQEYNKDKIDKAIFNSFTNSESGVDISSIGLNIISAISDTVEKKVISNLHRNGSVWIEIENIQDLVEESLREHGYIGVADSYNKYKNHRAELRNKRQEPDNRAISDYIHADKYARWIEKLGRREVYSETVDRNKNMNVVVYPQVKEELDWAYNFVYNKEVLPSMRSFQFGGKAIFNNHGRMFNCTFSNCDRTEFFAEAFWRLLCGSGVGFSVQWHHVEQLPEVIKVNSENVTHHICEDTIEGWADAIDFLINCYLVTGKYPEFSYYKIRKKGVLLKTSGGKAPGHIPLKKCIQCVMDILENAGGRKLKPIECHDIMCHIAQAVLSGGIRRSAMISLFSIDDGEMMQSKTGNWFDLAPWRQYANNTVVCYLPEINESQFKRIFKMTKQWGEPGVFFTNNKNYGINPCAEIGLNPNILLDDETIKMINNWFLEIESKNISFYKSQPRKNIISPDIASLRKNKGKTLSGWQDCNLTEINCATCKDEEDFYNRAKAASIIGTCQAGYTNLHYLTWVSRFIAWRESLIGVSLTGVMDNPLLALSPDVQTNGANVVKETNAVISKKIGINPAARCTCIKPSGTASLELGCIGSGIHYHHARRYFRRVIANPLESVFRYFFSINPHMCDQLANGDYVVVFPVKAPENALTVKDSNTIDFINKVLSTYKNWILPGTVNSRYSPDLTNNVSCTVTVKKNEWDMVSKLVWENRTKLSALSFVPYSSDKDYKNAPREEIKTEEDEKKWDFLIECYTPVNYSKMTEMEDNTTLKGEAACSGGSCEINL